MTRSARTEALAASPTPSRRVWVLAAALAAAVIVVGVGSVRERSATAAKQTKSSTSPSTKRGAAPVKVVPASFSEEDPYVAPEFIGLQNWVNSAPLTLSGLKGKVVLVNFWTFGCYNCQNTIPHVKDLYAKYHSKGFEIVGIHAPEFDFEKDAANVKKAVAKDGIAWPVAQDNGFKTWRRYKNGYWPAFYYLDKTGKVRHLHIGEGGYANQDAVVAALLAE